MSDNDKIYELFRRHEHKLDEKPSRRAWERLDARLDRHDAKRVAPSWLKYGGMVAAVLILVVTATMLTLNTQMENEQFASLEKSDMMESPLLDFETAGNNDNYLRIVAYQREYKNRGNRMTEQTMAGNLKPRGSKRKKESKPTMSVDIDQAIAANDIIEEVAAPEMLYEDAEDEVIAESITPVEMPTEEDEKVENEEEVVAAVAATEKTEEKKMMAEVVVPAKATTTAPAPASAPAMSELAVVSGAATEGNADYKADMKEEARSAKSKDMPVVEESVSYDMNMEDDSFVGMADKEDLSLTSFDWLLGNWKGNVNGSESTEKWTKIDASTYKGKGTLTAGGTTLFSEKLEIKKTSVGTYLTVSLDKKNKRVAYRMTSNEGGTIVFENRSVSYPQKIVMKKNADNSFSMTMQNGDTGSLDSNQIEYLESRNSIVGEKLIRSLKKSN